MNRVPPARPSLRPAKLDDADDIAVIWHSGWYDEYQGRVPRALVPHRGLTQFRARVPLRLDTMTVAVVHGRIAGFIVTIGDEVEQLFVAVEARGTGVAASLLRHGEEMIATNFGRAFLAVVTANARARRFYERNGWHDVGAIRYPAWATREITVPVNCRRYEKDLTERSARQSAG